MNYSGGVNSNPSHMPSVQYGYPPIPHGPAASHLNNYNSALPSATGGSAASNHPPTQAPASRAYSETVKVAQPSAPVSVTSAKTNEQGNSYVSPLAMDSAVGNVLRWAGAVMTGLQEMQWRHIGYERLPDGSLDTSRPLYSMNNPNSTIADIIQLYSSETMASLQFLVKEADSYRQQAIKDAMVVFGPEHDSDLSIHQLTERETQPQKTHSSQNTNEFKVNQFYYCAYFN